MSKKQKKAEMEPVAITLVVSAEKWARLQEMAQGLKTESLKFIEEPMSWGCCVCPLDSKKCEKEKAQHAMRNPDNSVARFDCYGALMRWLFWED